MNAVSRSPTISDGVGKPSVARNTSSNRVIARAARSPTNPPATIDAGRLEAPGMATVAARRRRLGRVELFAEPAVLLAMPDGLHSVEHEVAERDAVERCIGEGRNAAGQRRALRGHVRQTQRSTACAPRLR